MAKSLSLGSLPRQRSVAKLLSLGFLPRQRSVVKSLPLGFLPRQKRVAKLFSQSFALNPKSVSVMAFHWSALARGRWRPLSPRNHLGRADGASVGGALLRGERVKKGGAIGRPFQQNFVIRYF
ncbi:hypothetical protein OAQ84_01865 [Bdellovibrionales bacterium]|nr:hypothetical protein [Bdellovibrionales bacterium]